MADVTQVQLTEDGSRPVDLPEQFADVAAMSAAFKEAQATITRLSQAHTAEPVTPPANTKPKANDGLTVEMRSALASIGVFNETQRKLRFEAQVGPEGLAALNTYISGDAIDAGVKAAYEAALDSGNEALVDANFAMIRNIFEAQHGAFLAPENLVAGTAGGGMLIPAGTKTFASLGEQLAAQKDPKYATDAAFRAEVEQRIAISGPYRA